MPKLYLETYGCQMNIADGETLLGLFRDHGYVTTRDACDADVILLNTCAIREHAEARVLGRLAQLAPLKRRRPGVTLGVTGCMAQHLRRRLLEAAPYVDLVVGPDGYRGLPQALVGRRGDPHVDLRLDPSETYADVEPVREGRVRAWLPAMRGCDRFCTFCIVPFVRGRERSVPGAALIEQVESLALEGFREIVYLGQTVNAYNDGRWDFADLLRHTARVEGIARIRFTSPHPAEMSDRLIAAMASEPKVAPHLHLPVQSGSDRVLRAMEREYTVDDYERLVRRLRAAIPDIALSTDVMVGFPTETPEDFQATLDLLARIRCDHAFMFKYSPRPGTRAHRWGDPVPDSEKGRRLRLVIELQERIAAARNARLLGKEVEVLLEGPARRPQGWFMGRTPQFKTVICPAGGIRQGDLARVRVAHTTAHTLIAESPRTP